MNGKKYKNSISLYSHGNFAMLPMLIAAVRKKANDLGDENPVITYKRDCFKKEKSLPYHMYVFSDVSLDFKEDEINDELSSNVISSILTRKVE